MGPKIEAVFFEDVWLLGLGHLGRLGFVIIRLSAILKPQNSPEDHASDSEVQDFVSCLQCPLIEKRKEILK